MIKHNITSILFLLIIQISFSQDYDILDEVKLECIYNLSYRQDSTNMHDIREELMILYIGERVSSFQSYNAVLGKQYQEENPPPQPSELTSETFSEYRARKRQVVPPYRFRFEIFKHYPADKITTTDYVMPDRYLYQEPINLMNWQICDEESKKIFKYKARKATTSFGGRDWIAWFVPEIPISEGPYKFHGLPGLIIKVKDTKDHYAFELKSIEIPEIKKYIRFQKRSYIKTSKKEVFKARQHFKNNIISGAKGYGIDNPELHHRAAQSMQRRNNPIELTYD